jgi:PilZ domain
MARLTMTQAVERLAEGSLITAEDAEGRQIELTPTAHAGTRLTVTAERLRVSDAGEITARVHGEDLRPWVIRFSTESASYQTPHLALVELRACGIRLDQNHRRADRTAHGGHARLVAVNCQDVVDGDVVEGSIVDVSDSGVAFLTRRVLRQGDRLLFSGRFFATVVEAEVRVARVTEVAGQREVGCKFISINPSERAKLRGIITARPGGGAADFSLLQQLAAERAAREAEEPAPRWRRLFRRSA